MSPDPTRDLVAVGSAIVDHTYELSNLPEPGGGAFVHDAWDGFGGVAGNVASAAARLGRSVGMVARLGRDGDADAVLADLHERGIDTARVRRGEEPSTYSMVLRGPDGERMVVAGGAATAALSLDDADIAYARDARAVFTNAYIPDGVVSTLVDARAASRLPPLAFDLSGPLPELDGRATTPATIDRAVGVADLLVVGEVALRSYCEHHGTDEAGAVPLLRELGVERAALTRGADGALLVTPERTVPVPAYDVAVCDTTGAGDAFIAGLIDAWLLDGRPPRAAGRHAAAVAAMACTGDGARGGLPTRTAVERFRADRDGN